MCGILGGNSKEWNYKAGIDAMKHRGPDGTKVVRMNDFVLAFARLSIIDLSENGMQPMFSRDGQVAIVFNGEIYGYKKLRKKLMERGFQFKSSSDTEVILNAYLEWGETFITLVDGMYGIAIYDKRDGKLRLFRDRMGIKPLYYYYDGTNFGFASELKGIIAMCSNVVFRIDNTAVYDYLNYLYIPEPKTYYKNVYKLCPGYRLVFDIEQKKIEKNKSYWKLEVNTYQGSRKSIEDSIEELKDIIEESVKEQMIADVPIGTFLSGGVDSSIITYECSRVNPQIQSYSIGFSDKRYDETGFAALLAKRYNISNIQKMFTHNDYNGDYSKIQEWYDEPFADTSAFPTYLVSKLARKDVTVVLSGDGADEIFGGYERYNLFSKNEKEMWKDRICSFVHFLLKKHIPLDDKVLDNISFIETLYRFPLSERDKIIRKKLGIQKDYDSSWVIRKHYIKDLPARTRLQYIDLKTYLPNDILTKVDRVSMAVSLEVRVPFLSRRIVEFVFSLSEEERFIDNKLKGFLKRAYENEIGKDLLYRRKMGFSIPSKYYGRLSPQEELLERIWMKGGQ